MEVKMVENCVFQRFGVKKKKKWSLLRFNRRLDAEKPREKRISSAFVVKVLEFFFGFEFIGKRKFYID
jgi:hypothetical protein